MFKKIVHNIWFLVFLAIVSVLSFGYIIKSAYFPSTSADTFTVKNIPIEPTLSPTPTLIPTPTDEEFAESLWRLVQDWRVKNNYQTYTKSQNMCKIAEIRVKEVQVNWSHDGFVYTRFCKSCYLGENLAREYETEVETLNAWENSSSHLAELSKSYTHSCIVNDGNYTTQIFGYY